jgi:predicted metallo-beta-lactamase superfamily hydrolase
MIGGPPTYLAAVKVDDKEIKVGLENLAKIVKAIPCVILEHHILRDESWREKTKAILDKARRVLTAAEYLGRENLFLEAFRKRLFEEDSPAKDFQKWMQASRETKMRVKPPF